uniref:Zinc finger MYM-type protein 1-like n=1 Tax=Dermatophagoides pteronyssinus TaxID=6956 RepID=A0A6P6XZL7_DERPT|nr:zinc finger MYM-type protein 1-like [Dermatophagoides pteronyssinus]
MFNKKKLSGAQNRKRKMEKEKTAKKLSGSLAKFLKTTNTEDENQNNKNEKTVEKLSVSLATNTITSEDASDISEPVIDQSQIDSTDTNGQTFFDDPTDEGASCSDISEPVIYQSQIDSTDTNGQTFFDDPTDEGASCSDISEPIIETAIPYPSTNQPVIESLDCSSTFILEDPATWPENISLKIRDFLVENLPKHIKHSYPKDKNGRSFSENYFFRILPNGEKVKRQYLVYSKSLNSVFCSHCKLFGGPNSRLSNDSGVNDWRHLATILKTHESSSNHLSNSSKFLKLKNALKNKTTIDGTNQQIIENEKNYWLSVLERIILLIQFLGRQCLAIRGSTQAIYSEENGNFLKLVETVAKFDNVMNEHLRRIQFSGKSFPSYLGDKIQNEIIHLVSNAVKNRILEMVEKSKYFAVVLDTTPDCSHKEQLSIIIRFVHHDDDTNAASIQERFLGFIALDETTGTGLFNAITSCFQSLNLKIENLRAQSYDNAANMKGKKNGLQKKILELNSRAFFVPCSAHSLNLVVNDAAKMSFETVNFFDLIQEFYNFFSASPRRWGILKKHMPHLSLKPLSATRWESRIESIRPFKIYLNKISNALEELSDDDSFDLESRTKASNLNDRVASFKFICGIQVWHLILDLINVSSKLMQSPRSTIGTISDSLQKVLSRLREFRSDEFFENNIIKEASKAAESINVEAVFEESRRRKKTKSFDYESSDSPLNDPKSHFKVDFFFAILDIAITSVEERFTLLNQHMMVFDLIKNCNDLEKFDDLKNRCLNLEKKLTDINDNNKRDIDGKILFEELCSLKTFLEKEYTPLDVLNFLYENNLIDTFPNTAVALRIFLTMPASVASGERTFSKLKLIKNYLRSSMSADRLSGLAIMSIESDIMEAIDIKETIKEFAIAKARRVHII